MIMGKTDFLPRDKSIQESYSNLLEQAHCLVNLSDICVKKCKYGYKPTLYHVLSLYNNVKVIFKTCKMYS